MNTSHPAPYPTAPTHRLKAGFLAISLATLALALCTSPATAQSAKVVARPAAETADAPVALRIELDRSILPANTQEKAIVKISLDGLKRERAEVRPPVNLTIVLDRSGSMNGEKIKQARDAAIEALNRLAAEDIFSLVAFDSSVETIIPATRVGNGEALEARIRRIQANGSTALYGGVAQGASEIRKNLENARYIHRIIILSDGQANQGPSTPEELGRLGVSLVKEGISVTTVGLGRGYDEDLMTRLALRSDGNTYFVEGASDLPRIFTAELGDVLNVVARRILMKIEFPEGIRPIRFVGREGTINGQNAEVTLNQVYGGQEKYAMLEVEVSPRANGVEDNIVIARVTFENPVSQESMTLSLGKGARFSTDREAVVRSANLRVQTDYAKNLVAITQEEVITLVDAGKKTEAAQLMKTNSISLNTLGSSYNNIEIINISGGMEKDAEAVAVYGFGDGKTSSVVGRKQMVSKAASAGTQQSFSTVATDNKIYITQSGDTGARIAKMHGMTLAELDVLNPGIQWPKLKVGQPINVREDANTKSQTSSSSSSSSFRK